MEEVEAMNAIGNEAPAVAPAAEEKAEPEKEVEAAAEETEIPESVEEEAEPEAEEAEEAEEPEPEQEQEQDEPAAEEPETPEEEEEPEEEEQEEQEEQEEEKSEDPEETEEEPEKDSENSEIVILKEILDRLEYLAEQNAELRTHLREVLSANSELEKQIAALAEANSGLKAQSETLIEKNAELEKQLEALGSVQTELNQKIDETNKAAVSHAIMQKRMGDELDKYRKNLYASIAEPFIYQLITIHTSLISDLKDYKKETLENEMGSLEDWVKTLKYYNDTVEGSLSNCGVEVFRPEIDTPVDTLKNSIVKTIPTDDPDKNGIIASVRSSGYIYNGKILRPAKVVVYKLK